MRVGAAIGITTDTFQRVEAIIQAHADVVVVDTAHADSEKVLNITRIVTGVGVPQVYAIKECARACREGNVTLIADGGIRYSGDICKALAVGADSVMIGSLFAGTEESPGEVVLYKGRSYKEYRGMGSIGAMKEGSQDRYFQEESESSKLVPEGIGCSNGGWSG